MLSSVDELSYILSWVDELRVDEFSYMLSSEDELSHAIFWSDKLSNALSSVDELSYIYVFSRRTYDIYSTDELSLAIFSRRTLLRSFSRRKHPPHNLF